MIGKRTINLLIRREQDVSSSFYRWNHYLPRIAGIFLGFFLLASAASFLYLRLNIGRFETMKTEIAILEQVIGQKKTTEGLYTAVQQKLTVIERLQRQQKQYTPLLTALLELKNPSVNYSTVVINPEGTITMSVSAASSQVLDDFINLVDTSDQHNSSYTHMIAKGIQRDRSGLYTFILEMKPGKKLLE